ncbi:HAD family hydrolase [Aquirufa regiilacus]|uniref:HAD family phosphatase n=1 Tax=Aquirufa regiilacus TaxID=3024868 RepID=A0ABU3TTA8_9BACT|nr:MULTISPECIES: HAD family phosphatase [unclassified Aquirufa]MDT8887690.1 HAD family phosphatase [Aquirufa sp. LEPPI-3A]MDU0809099.1 HAD family phosphatase [Aquirufa sp. LEOWEIH-7C]
MKAVLFDMDGVVVDNLPYHVDAWLLFCERHNIPLTREVFYRELNGMNSKDTFEWFYQKEMSRSEVEVLEEEKEILYRGFYKEHMKPAAGLVTFIKALRAHGIKTALATSAGPGNIDFIVDGLGIRDQFDAIIGGAEVRKGKPDPEIYLKAAALVGVDPADCWVIEDSLQGIASGLNAGMQVVGITTSHTAEELAHTHWIAADFVNLFEHLEERIS